MISIKKCFKKPCRDCGKMFRPYTKSTRLCDDCYRESQINSGNKRASKKDSMKENKKFPYKSMKGRKK